MSLNNLTCEHCLRKFSYKRNLTCHLNMKHNINLNYHFYINESEINENDENIEEMLFSYIKGNDNLKKKFYSRLVYRVSKDDEFNEKIICIFRILKILIRSVEKKRLNSINEYLGVEN